MVCLSRPYTFKFFKVRLPQILLGPFLKTLLHITLNQTQCEEHRNENRSVNTNGNQLIEFRQKQQDKFAQIRNPPNRMKIFKNGVEIPLL